MKISLPSMEDFSYLKLLFYVISIPTLLMTLFMFIIQRESISYKVTHEVFFDIEINSEPIGKIVFGLFGETVPLTAHNFYTFATAGFEGKKYEGTTFHRVIPNFLVQGGDVLHGNGSGQMSMFGQKFDDENFRVHHSAPGYLSMANTGKNSNGCQFFITTVATPGLDGRHVAFGKVIKGEGDDVLARINFAKTDENFRPVDSIRIAKSGSRPVQTPYMISNDPYNITDWAKTMALPITLSAAIGLFFYHFIKKFDRCLETGEMLRKKEDLVRKALKEIREREERIQTNPEDGELRKRN